MKKIALVLMAMYIMSMGACFSPWDGSGGQGTIVINVGNSGARAAAADSSYTVVLTNSGDTLIKQPITGGSAVFSVQPGDWNILVRSDKDGMLKGYGVADVVVKAGATVPAVVILHIIQLKNVTEVVSSWGHLHDVFKNGGDETIVIANNLEANYTIETKNKNITLLAEKPITIVRTKPTPNSLFRVTANSTLTLGAEDGMGKGSITIKGGNWGRAQNSSLIYVGTLGLVHSVGGGNNILNMYDGVTLTGNYANVNNRGGAVVVHDGTFNMKGGIISGNSALYGGGVRVLSGTFTKTGGIIYGNDADSNSNKATFGSGDGHAVYFDIQTTNNNNKDTTVGPNDKFENGSWTS